MKDIPIKTFICAVDKKHRAVLRLKQPAEYYAATVYVSGKIMLEPRKLVPYLKCSFIEGESNE